MFTALGPSCANLCNSSRRRLACLGPEIDPPHLCNASPSSVFWLQTRTRECLNLHDDFQYLGLGSRHPCRAIMAEAFRMTLAYCNGDLGSRSVTLLPWLTSNASYSSISRICLSALSRVRHRTLIKPFIASSSRSEGSQTNEVLLSSTINVPFGSNSQPIGDPVPECSFNLRTDLIRA